MKLNGVDVTRVVRVVWQHDDERELRHEGMRVMGRARVETAGGGLFHGLVVAWSEPILRLENRLADVRIHRRVVVWERTTARFVLLPFTEEGTV